MGRFVGIDVGAETIKLVELVREPSGLRWTRRALASHGKEPRKVLLSMLQGWQWGSVEGAAASGRLSRHVEVPRIPGRQAQAMGCRFLHGAEPTVVISIGSRGCSVLEL